MSEQVNTKVEVSKRALRETAFIHASNLMQCFGEFSVNRPILLEDGSVAQVPIRETPFVRMSDEICFFISESVDTVNPRIIPNSFDLRAFTEAGDVLPVATIKRENNSYTVEILGLPVKKRSKIETILSHLEKMYLNLSTKHHPNTSHLVAGERRAAFSPKFNALVHRFFDVDHPITRP